MQITSKSIKTWSIIGSRPTYGLAVMELVKEFENLMVVTGDVSTSAVLDRYRKTFPEKYVDVGIAEQNMIGVAAGLADNGFNVFTTTFAPFQVLRCLDQIKVDLAYSNVKVTMTGLASGLVNGPLGNTHCCIEDVGALRSIPNLTILSPADGVGIFKSVFAAAEHDKPTFIRLTGGASNPIVYKEDVDYKIGKAIEIMSGEDLTIFATGTMVNNSLQAANILAEKGISASIFDMHTIKPIDEVVIAKAIAKNKPIVTVEEHSVIGGLASAVSECISSHNKSPQQISIGINDFFPKPGDYQYMLKQCGLMPEQIAQNILSSLSN